MMTTEQNGFGFGPNLPKALLKTLETHVLKCSCDTLQNYRVHPRIF